MNRPLAPRSPLLLFLALLFTACGEEEPTPDESVEIVPEGPVIDVAAGGFFTCALKADGTVWCWGQNDYAQLGANRYAASLVPLQVPGVFGAKRIVAGFDHVCALLQDGTLSCWGSNLMHQLGREERVELAYPPALVPGLAGVGAVSSGWDHVCVLLLDQTHLCWGSNDSGQSGQASILYVPFPTPSPIAGIEGPLRQIAAGRHHTCLIRDDGNLWCVGSNMSGALSIDPVDPTMPRVEVPGFMGVTSRVAAGHDATCAIKNDETVWCWGQPAALGDGSPAGTRATIPVEVASMRGARALGFGWNHTCAVRDGGVSCWGTNLEGQLGPAAAERELEPVAVPGVSGVAVLSVGPYHKRHDRRSDRTRRRDVTVGDFLLSVTFGATPGMFGGAAGAIVNCGVFATTQCHVTTSRSAAGATSATSIGTRLVTGQDVSWVQVAANAVVSGQMAWHKGVQMRDQSAMTAWAAGAAAGSRPEGGVVPAHCNKACGQQTMANLAKRAHDAEFGISGRVGINTQYARSLLDLRIPERLERSFRTDLNTDSGALERSFRTDLNTDSGALERPDFAAGA